MASYALLNAFSGFEFDMVNNRIGFNPVFGADRRFRCFWSLDSGYGTVEIEPGRAAIHLLSGELSLKTVRLPFIVDGPIKRVSVGGKPVGFTFRDGILELQATVKVDCAHCFEVDFSV
jgi:hypothetical protein